MREDLTPRYIDMDGTPMELLDWARARKDAERRTLAFDSWYGSDGVEYRLITVWLGPNEPEVGDWPFGTALRYGDDGHEETNYMTRDEAVAGHARLVVEYKARTGVGLARQ